jgi:endonuclease-3
MDELLTLPGVGRKTANVIRGTLFNKPAIIVDTHFKRVTNRIGLTSESNPDKIESDIILITPKKDQMNLSMVLNIHGREYCFARKPNCDGCPVSEICSFFNNL